VGPEHRNALLGGAYALLHLVNFEEPFGFSVVEAMACGTPVVASRRGSMPELIDDARTGFLVNDVDEALLAVSRAATLDRRAVRQDAVARFGRDRMVDAYLEVYERVVSAGH
jgi:glycosyltransferase involved in cell wall biosynthesis